MAQAIVDAQEVLSWDCGRPSAGGSTRTVFWALGLIFVLLAGARLLDVHHHFAFRGAAPPQAKPAAKAEIETVGAALPAVVSHPDVALLDPALALGARPVSFTPGPPPGPSPAGFAPIAIPPETPVAAPAAAAATTVPAGPAIAMASDSAVVPTLTDAAAAPEEVRSPQLASRAAETVPLPLPRPPEMRARIGPVPFAGAGRSVVSPGRTSVSPPTPADNRSFIEKLFGWRQPAGPILAYATPEDTVIDKLRPGAGGPALSYDRTTAVYDISAHTVYLPNGMRLEAHSGLGDRLDDPRHVNERNRGATPPQIYDLEPRAQLFHGVQALRLNPVGGGGVYGRTGLLAHTYMLGPNGDSNGCVSFRDYNAFLRAYQNGEVRRLLVVARQI